MRTGPLQSRNRLMNKILRIVIVSVIALTVAITCSNLLVDDQAFGQDGRKSSDKKKKNPNSSGDPEEQRKEQERQEEKKVDKTIDPSSISIGTDVVNVEAVVFNKKTGGIFQGLKKENFEIYE